MMTYSQNELTEQMWSAIQENDVRALNELIHEGVDLEARNEKGMTPLMLATLSENDDVVSRILKEGVDKDSKDYFGNTALMYSLLNKKSRIFKLLLRNKADLEIKDNRGNTVLSTAASLGNVRAVQMLIGEGADVNTKNDLNQTPLMRSAECRRFDIMRRLIDAGALVNLQDNFGYSSLAHAVIGSSRECVALLLDSGADATLTDQSGSTPLSLIAVFGERDADAIWKTPMSKMKELGEKHLMLDAFVKKGVDINSKNASGETPLVHSISVMHNLALAKLFLAYGADMKIRDKYGKNALDYAKEQKDQKLISLFIERIRLSKEHSFMGKNKIGFRNNNILFFSKERG